MQRSTLQGVIVNLVTWTLVLLIAFPLLWMIITSVKPQTELFRIPPTWFPETITFEHYWRLLTETPFLIYFRNSVVLATTTTIFVVALGTLGAYSLVRFKYRGRETLAMLVLFTYLLPSVVLIIPLYLMMVAIGLSNTLVSLILAHTTFALPYALWLLRVLRWKVCPRIWRSAALVDGASRTGRIPGHHSAAASTRHHLDRAFHLHPVVERIPLRIGAGEFGQRRTAHHRRDVDAHFGLQHRMVPSHGGVRDDEPSAHYRLRLPAKLSDQRLRCRWREG